MILPEIAQRPEIVGNFPEGAVCERICGYVATCWKLGIRQLDLQYLRSLFCSSLLELVQRPLDNSWRPAELAQRQGGAFWAASPESHFSMWF